MIKFTWKVLYAVASGELELCKFNYKADISAGSEVSASEGINNTSSVPNIDQRVVKYDNEYRTFTLDKYNDYEGEFLTLRNEFHLHTPCLDYAGSFDLKRYERAC